MVIGAVGIPELWELATRLLRRGGVVNFFGGCAMGTRVNIDTNLLHYSELTLKASFHHRRPGRKAPEAAEPGLRFREGLRESCRAAHQPA